MQKVRSSKPHTAWASLLTLCLIIAILITAKSVLVPLALGVILAFTLTPVVRLFDRFHLPRAIGVTLSLALLLGLVGGLGYVLTSQITELSEQANKYSYSMREKVRELRKQGGGGLGGLTRTVDKITEQLDDNAAMLRRAQPVRVIPERLTPVERLRDVAGSIFQPLASAVIVLVLVAFMLGQREDLRDRIIRLIGADNITITTRLIDDAAHRVSQFLIAQTLINLGVGVLVALGLYWIDVPYAILWGGLTTVLRFVPYVGTTLSALMPACLAFAVFPGWAEVVQTLALFAALDLLAGYLVEPVVLGRRTGVSSFALLVSALFWIWVWGPVGLLLATPLTVCIGVLGRHVRSLRFLAVMLADEPALSPPFRYYQRLLARDQPEAKNMVEQQLAELGRIGVLDEIVIPALALTHQHYQSEEIADADVQFVLDSTHELVRQIPGSDAPRDTQSRLLCLGSAGEIDQALLDVVASAIEPPLAVPEMVSPELSQVDVEALAAQANPTLICIAAMTPQGVAEARSYCRKLRARLGHTKILVVHPLTRGTEVGRAAQRLREAGADAVAATLQEALSMLESMAPAVVPVPNTESSGNSASSERVAAVSLEAVTAP
jgi:predicted PurR-regulated permease PerM